MIQQLPWIRGYTTIDRSRGRYRRGCEFVRDRTFENAVPWTIRALDASTERRCFSRIYFVQRDSLRRINMSPGARDKSRIAFRVVYVSLKNYANAKYQFYDARGRSRRAINGKFNSRGWHSVFKTNASRSTARMNFRLLIVAIQSASYAVIVVSSPLLLSS